MSSPLQPLRLAAVVGVALLAGAGCAATPEPDPVPAPPVSLSPEASPSAAPGDDEPASDQGLSGGGSSSGGSSSGGSSGGGSSGGGSGGSSWPSPADCLAYNPANLSVQYENGRYLVRDGSTVVAAVSGYDGDGVVEKALAVAQRYRKHCFIGRGNGREDANTYVFDYWRDASGMKPAIPGQEDDCSSYDRTDLTADDMGSGHGWRVRENDHVLHVFDNERDARAGQQVLGKYGRICYLGSGDDNAEILTYFP